ncbi:MAG: hypothetical protein R3B13_03050 [Polyangiaceae bacterium]
MSTRRGIGQRALWAPNLLRFPVVLLVRQQHGPAVLLGLLLFAVAPPATAQSAARSGTSNRQIFVGIVGALALVVGVAGAYASLRRRRRATATETPPAAPTVAIVTPPSAAHMVCPTCRAEYEAGDRFCKRDGNRLIAAPETSDPRAPSGGVCPVCDHGYDPGVSTCPSDGEELVPWALCQRRSEPSIEPDFSKICPTCGIQYPSGSGFCQSDGTALVMVN